MEDNKKIKYVVFTDTHLKASNINEVTNSVREIIKYCTDNGIREVCCLGDVFDSRKAQTQEVLIAFSFILDLFNENSLSLRCVVGNHDKTNYTSNNSFLDPFNHHPALILHSVSLSHKSETYMPYYSEDILLTKLQEDNIKKDTVLFGHFAVTGSRNNDGSLVEGITAKDLKKFKKVFLGHYHDTQEPMSNVVHLPSLLQNNFGENDKKGFTVIYEDLSYDIIPTNSTKYIKQVIDLDKFSNKDIVKLIEQHKNSTDKVRFEFVGDESKLKSIDKSIYVDSGIDVKMKIKEVEDNTEFDEVEMKEYDNTSIIEEFSLFCEDNSFSELEGLKYLKSHLK